MYFATYIPPLRRMQWFLHLCVRKGAVLVACLPWHLVFKYLFSSNVCHAMTSKEGRCLDKNIHLPTSTGKPLKRQPGFNLLVYNIFLLFLAHPAIN